MSRVDAASVNDGEGAGVPFRISEETVTGGAGCIVNDRHPLTDEAVE